MAASASGFLGGGGHWGKGRTKGRREKAGSRQDHASHRPQAGTHRSVEGGAWGSPVGRATGTGADHAAGRLCGSRRHGLAWPRGAV